MRRSALLLSTALALALAAVALLGIASLARPPQGLPVTDGSLATESVVRRFYEAVNDVIATGDSTAIRATVSADLVEHTPMATTESGRAALEDSLIALHAAMPPVRLRPETVLAAGDRAMAKVIVEGGTERSLLGSSIAPSATGWGSVDVFRVADGRVVERWADTDGVVLARTLEEVAFDVTAPASRALGVERHTVPSGAGTRWKAGAESLLLAVESGEVVVKPDPTGSEPVRPVYLVPVVPTAALETDAVDRSSRLTAGRWLVLPGGTQVVLWNDGRDTARVLATGLVQPAETVGERMPLGPRPSPGLTTETLAGGSARTLPTGRVSIQLALVVLGPHGHVSLPEFNGPVTFVVQAGDLRLTVSTVVTVKRNDGGIVTTVAGVALAGGDSAYLPPGGAATIVNADDRPVAVIVVALRTEAREAHTGGGGVDDP